MLRKWFLFGTPSTPSESHGCLRVSEGMKGAESIGTKTIPSSDSNSPKWFKASLPLAHRLYPGRFAACQGAYQLCFVVFEGDVPWGWVRWGWWWCWFWCAWSRWWTMRNHEKISFVQKYPSDHSIDMVHLVDISMFLVLVWSASRYGLNWWWECDFSGMKLPFWPFTSISFCISTHKCSRYLAAMIYLFNAHWSGVYAGCLVNDECCLGAAGSLVQSAGRTQLQLPCLGATLSS